MRGSVTLMGKKNKQPYFSVGIQKKTRVIYLGDKRAEKANEFVANYKKLLEIVGLCPKYLIAFFTEDMFPIP